MEHSRSEILKKMEFKFPFDSEEEYRDEWLRLLNKYDISKGFTRGLALIQLNNLLNDWICYCRVHQCQYTPNPVFEWGISRGLEFTIFEEEGDVSSVVLVPKLDHSQFQYQN